MKWLQDMLTEQDGTTPCVVRIGATVGLCIGLALSAAGWYFGKPFDVQNFGIGLGALLGSVGAALKWKPEQEPKP